ncbi:MAG: transcription antitermination factor NusB [Pseudomonadota bacterium]|nr:transcription antitermination factor NusB [Pseudomonadota bacterium]
MNGVSNQLRHERHWARRLALQAIYQWQLGGGETGEILDQFALDENMRRADADYFRELVRGVRDHVEELDAEIGTNADRAVASIDPVELALLRSACYELFHRPDVPYRVVITEAVTLARKFGAEDGYKYVNAVLDGVATRTRAVEAGTGG